ncbi:GTPase activating protein [Biscogniauxia mediterranea]|nr:GTPase activating protein [Biscogniauxia mediterranea]
MPGFADSFWSPDYAAGLGVLFGKLQQGVQENRQVLTIARLRAEAEEVYGQRLGDIAPAADKVAGGFSRDEGASVRKAYDGVRSEMEDASKTHKKIAQSIRDLVVNPFSRWCDAHESRIQDSQDDLQARIKIHDRQVEAVKKLRSNYFNKCRVVEDIEEENKLAFQDPETSPKPSQNIPEIKVSANKEEEEEEVYEIGDETYQAEQVKKILTQMLNTIKIGETKVPILGTYLNTSCGSDIVEYLQRHMDVPTVSYAERIGQDLVGNGFLRLVGNVGNNFANSSKLFYQWRPKAFQMTGIPEKKTPVARTFSMPTSNDGTTSDSPVVGAVSEYLSGWNVLNNQHPNETPPERMRREAREADEKYKAAVKKLDEMRCELEEAIYQHLKFLERCELDRLKAIKTVVLDFSGTIGNVIPSLQSAVDRMVLYQETVQPMGDLRYLLENYRTGRFAPKVVTYENYYNKVDEQTFGVDLEARARADKKRVPIIVTTILTYLDHHYPDLEGDEARRGVWLADVQLAQAHKLRAKVNDGKPFSADALADFDIPTVAYLLKLYLLELPDSLVSSHVYEIIRTIYSTPTTDSSDEARVAVLQQTLSQLRLTNIATLDACMNHFTRLIDLTSADEQYVQNLATSLAPCILRPRTETSLTMEEKHPARLIRDLFTHKDAIFSELKRMSTLSHTVSVGNNRPRAISTDESNRRAHMEERQRALMEKAGPRGRATSPAPGLRSHRRDRSAGGPETRFPIASPTSSNDRQRSSLGSLGPKKRSSLEVPDGSSTPPSEVNGGSHAHAEPPRLDTESIMAKRDSFPKRDSMGRDKHDSGFGKRDSIGRSGARFVGGRRVTHTSTGSTPSTPKTVDSGNSDTPTMTTPQDRGVTLVDAPMDD